jgi:RNA polymerase primary sigma factor
MFIRAGKRARKELEDSGWVSDEDREMHAHAICVGRQAEAGMEGPSFTRPTSTTDVKRAYEVLLANVQLCRQILDEEPTADKSLLDIHFDACSKLKELRDGCQEFESAMPTFEPDQRPHAKWLQTGAKHSLRMLIEVFQTWEQMHAPALNEAHERDADMILRRSEQSVGSVIPTVPGGLAKLHTQPHALLTKAEEFELARRIEEGNQAYTDLSEFGCKCETARSELVDKIQAGQTARQRLALMNLRLVASIAIQAQRRFPSSKRGSLTFDDLLQEGDIGLVLAIEKYDWKKGYRFSTYATYYIRQNIRKAILEKGTTIRVPIARVEQIRKLKLHEKTYAMEYGRSPTDQELLEHLKVKKNVLKTIQGYAAQSDRVYSLDAPVQLPGGSTGRESTHMGRCSDSALLPMEQLSQQEWNERRADLLWRTMHKLSERELRAIGMRFALEGGEKASMEQIAEALGLHRKSAWKIVHNAISKLQRAVGKQRAEDDEDLDYDVDLALIRAIYEDLMSTVSSRHPLADRTRVIA